jgi:hypothetical protein
MSIEVWLFIVGIIILTSWLSVKILVSNTPDH